MAFLYVLEIVLGKKLLFVLVFNNRIQINFGRTSNRSSNSTQTVNLPLSFYNNTYSVVEANRGNYNQQESGIIISQSTSSFIVFAWSGRATNWIAIGRGT